MIFYRQDVLILSYIKNIMIQVYNPSTQDAEVGEF